MRRVLRVGALAAGMGLLSGAATAGVEMHTETRKQNGEIRKGKALFDGPRLRIDTSDGRRAIVYRGDKNVIWVIDHKKKRYIEVEKPTSSALAGQAKKQLDSLPADKKAAADLGAAVASGVEVKDTGRKGEVLGVSCDELHVMSGKARLADICRATYASAGVDRASFAAVKELQSLLGGSLTAMLPEDSRAEGTAALESFARLDGVPMRVRTYEAGQLDTETVVKQLKNKKLPRSDFSLPDGYSPQLTINIR